jgi:hypothetical protein
VVQVIITNAGALMNGKSYRPAFQRLFPTCMTADLHTILEGANARDYRHLQVQPACTTLTCTYRWATWGSTRLQLFKWSGVEYGNDPQLLGRNERIPGNQNPWNLAISPDKTQWPRRGTLRRGSQRLQSHVIIQDPVNREIHDLACVLQGFPALNNTLAGYNLGVQAVLKVSCPLPPLLRMQEGGHLHIHTTGVQHSYPDFQNALLS